MKIIGLCLIAFAAAAPACAAPTNAATGEVVAGPPAMPTEVKSSGAAPGAEPRFIYGTPDENVRAVIEAV